MFLLLFFGLPKTVSAISFTIENPVREGDYFIVDASISGITAASAYVQGMFTSSTSSNFFGFTWGQKEDWVEYQSSTTKDFITANFPILLKNNPQKIWIRPNYTDSGFKGSGDYYLKLKRYTGSSDGDSGESNTLTVYLLSPALPTDSPTPSPSPTNTPEPTITLAPTRTPTPTPLKTPTPTVIASATRQSSSLSPTPTSIKTPSQSVIPAQAGIHQITPTSSSTPSSVLADSTSSSVILSEVEGPHSTPSSTPSAIQSQSPNNYIYKYTFIFGAILTSVSGGWLYFRHKKD